VNYTVKDIEQLEPQQEVAVRAALTTLGTTKIVIDGEQETVIYLGATPKAVTKMVSTRRGTEEYRTLMRERIAQSGKNSRKEATVHAHGEKVYSAPELAAACGFNNSTIYHWCQTGKIESFTIRRRRWVRKSAWEKFALENNIAFNYKNISTTTTS
jgi:hypothetical protein